MFTLARRTASFRQRSDAALLRLPLIGRLARGYNAARVDSTLAMLAAAGVPIVKALQAAAETLGNRAMRSDTLDALAQVREGAKARRGRVHGRGRNASRVCCRMSARLREKTEQLALMLQRASVQLSPRYSGVRWALPRS